MNNRIKNKGKLIAIEGIDGAGKSTIIDSLGKYYKNKEICVISGVGNKAFISELERCAALGNFERNALFSQNLTNIAWLMDFYSTGCKISQMLNAGKNVLVDRYILSAKVYAEATTDVDMTYYYPIYDTLPKPDICFLIDVLPSLAVKRIKTRGKKLAPYENSVGLECIRKKYWEIIFKENMKIIEINGAFDRDRVLENMVSYLDQIL